MDIEFHYNIIYLLARRTGFEKDEAYILAYSSQYVDDNNLHYYVNFEDGGHFINEVSQAMDITKPSVKRQKIYPIFHFIPGDPDSPTARRKDGKTHVLCTTPDSDNAVYLLNKALETKNLYRIGIALHAYADTWAHQNFTGTKDKFNAMNAPWDYLIPNIGHADAGHKPDKVGTKWKDDRLIEELEHIDNDTRFLVAAEQIFQHLWKFKGRGQEELTDAWVKTKKELVTAMQVDNPMEYIETVRKKAYKKLCPEMPEYDEKAWRHQAVEKLPFETDYFDKYWAKEGFEQSHWYRFQMAIKAHRDLALDLLKPLYKQAGLPV